MSAEWLTTRDAATHAGRHITTIHKAAEAGELHGHQTGRGGRWSFRPAAVDAWVMGTDGATACGCPRLRLAKRVAAA